MKSGVAQFREETDGVYPYWSEIIECCLTERSRTHRRIRIRTISRRGRRELLDNPLTDEGSIKRGPSTQRARRGREREVLEGICTVLCYTGISTPTRCSARRSQADSKKRARVKRKKERKG